MQGSAKGRGPLAGTLLVAERYFGLLVCPATIHSGGPRVLAVTCARCPAPGVLRLVSFSRCLVPSVPGVLRPEACALSLAQAQRDGVDREGRTYNEAIGRVCAEFYGPAFEAFFF